MDKEETGNVVLAFLCLWEVLKHFKFVFLRKYVEQWRGLRGPMWEFDKCFFYKFAHSTSSAVTVGPTILSFEV